MADGLLLEGRLPSPALDCIRVIRDSGVALLAQVNNILDFARLSAKVVRANPQVRMPMTRARSIGRGDRGCMVLTCVAWRA